MCPPGLGGSLALGAPHTQTPQHPPTGGDFPHHPRAPAGSWSNLQHGGATWDVEIAVQILQAEESTTGSERMGLSHPSSGDGIGHLQHSQSLSSPFPGMSNGTGTSELTRISPDSLGVSMVPIRGDTKPQGHPRAPLAMGLTKPGFAQCAPSGTAWAPCPVGITEINQ